MSEKTREIRITPESVKKHAQTAIYSALLEAIYNSIDAEASNIKIVAINRNEQQMELFDESESLLGIKITDNGTGITPDKIDTGFLDLEKSWKAGLPRNGKRPFHGSKGCGRFKCLALGGKLTWNTVFQDPEGVRKSYSIQFDEQSATRLIVSDPVETESPTGTTLTILNPKTSFSRRIVSQTELKKLLFDILNGLILDLELGGCEVSVFGTTLQTDDYKEADEQFNFSFIDHEDIKHDGTVRILVWSSKVDFTDHKHAFLYKSDESFLAECPSGYPADYRWPAHTLIFTSSGFDKYDGFACDFLKLYSRVESATQGLVLQYLTSVKQKEFSSVLQTIYDDDRYPYKNTPNSPLDEAQRSIYNLVLGSLVFNNSRELAPKKKSLGVVMPLLHRLFQGDYLLGDSLERIVGLNETDTEKFHSFVTRIKLSKILTKYAELIRRKTFLETLSKLVYDETISEHLAERTQLHKIVAEEVWIFGEGYENENLLSNDKGLVTLIRSYIKRTDLRFDIPEDDAEVEKIISLLQEDKDSCIRKIPDLAMMKKIKDGEAEKFLVIELKKPSVKIDSVCKHQALDIFQGISQAKQKGALPIDEKHKWQYCLVSSNMDDSLENEFTSAGHLEEKESGNYVIDVWKWSTIIEMATKRINDAMDQLEIEVKDEDCKQLLDSFHDRFGIKLK